MKQFLLTLFATLMLLRIEAQVVIDRTNHIQIDFKNESMKTTHPKIDWIYPALEYTNSEDSQLEVRAKILSDKKLKKITLAVKTQMDGKPMLSKEMKISDNGLMAEFTQKIFLSDGQNYVEITAENESGGIVKDYRSVIVGMDALKDAIAIDRKDYAVFFATDKYDHWSDLVNPVYDSRAIAKELEERYGFEVELVENATQETVFAKMREYALKNYKPQDQLMIFFAGHGQYDETFGEGFVVARNSLQNDPGKTTYISHNRLRSNLDNIPCDHIFLAMDVCFGGTFDPVLASSRNVYDEIDNVEFIVKKLSVRTRKYLTSGSKEYVSDGVAGKHSPFAVKFLEALKSNGGGDRLLTLLELSVYMQRLQTTPRFGEFGSDQSGSEFLFIQRN